MAIPESKKSKQKSVESDTAPVATIMAAPAQEIVDADAAPVVDVEATPAVDETENAVTESAPVAEDVPVVEGASADSAVTSGDAADLSAVAETVTEASEAAPEAEVVTEAAPEAAPEAPEHVFGTLELSQFKGTVIGSGSFVGAKAKSLLNDIAEGKLDYVVISSSINNGFDRAVVVSPALFARINGLAQFSVIAQPISWAVNAPSFSRDALFAGRTAHAVGDFRVGRASAASALVHGLDRLYGYVISAADFHDSFAV